MCCRGPPCRFAPCVRPALPHPIVRSPLPGWRGADVIDPDGGQITRRKHAPKAHSPGSGDQHGSARIRSGSGGHRHNRSLRTRLSTPGPSPDRMAGKALGMTRRSRRTVPASQLRSDRSRCVYRIYLRAVSSPTRRIPSRLHLRPARRRTIRSTPPSFRLSRRRPHLSPDSL